MAKTEPEENTLDPLAYAVPLVSKAIHKWIAVNNPDTIERKVFQVLDKQRENILHSLLGVTNTAYGFRFQSDGPNNPKLLREYLATTQESLVKEWLSKIPLPELSESQKKRLTKDLKERVDYACLQLAPQIVEELVEQNLRQLLTNMIKNDSLQQFVKMMGLINSSGEQHG